MSKEKQCECCHEWWYGSDVKEDLCPNCYYYFKRLKQQLKEYKNKENTSAVNSWDEMLKNCENCGLNECIGCEYTQTCMQNIKQQLVEKDKEIEKLKQQYTILENENGKLTTELIMDKYKKAKKEVSFGKQLAIQELEKVKNFVDGRTYCADYIKKRIKELKGEKDE
jgi:predicted DsbA family dithiol-disulfide isomerase